jgi:hypothetical protein
VEFASTLSSCSESPEAANNCRNLLIQNDLDNNLAWLWVVLTFAIFAVARFAAGIVLYHKSKTFF